MLCVEITICKLIGVLYLVNTKFSAAGKTRKERTVKQNFKIIFTDVLAAFPKLLQGTINFTVVQIQTDSCESKRGNYLTFCIKNLRQKFTC